MTARQECHGKSSFCLLPKWKRKRRPSNQQNCIALREESDVVPMTDDVLINTVMVLVFLPPTPYDYSLMPIESNMYHTPLYKLDIEKTAPVS